MALQLWLGAASLLLVTTTAVLLFIITTFVSVVTHQSQFTLLLAAAILETLQSVSLVALLYRSRAWESPPPTFLGLPGQRRRRLELCLISAFSLASAVIVAAAFGLHASDPASSFFHRKITTAALIVWIITVFTLAFLLWTIAFAPRQQTDLLPEKAAGKGATLPVMQESSGPATPITSISNPFRDTLPTPPNLSPLDGSSSLRSSFSTTHRPPSSKHKLSVRSTSKPRHSERSSSDGPSRRPSQDEGFDAWDTSEVSAHIRETVQQSKPIGKPATLPTIPGSRSPSPAKALEGPFFNPSPERSPPISPLPQPSVSQQCSPISPQEGQFPARFPPSTQTPIATPPSSPPPTQRRFSRPPSLVRKLSGEHDIHPLFRCSSPTPPPSASSNTIVTAAPEAGEIIDRRTLHRMRSTSHRSSSQPPASSPLRRSESFANARSNRVPPSPSLPGAENGESQKRPTGFHQRKRSASFEGCIIRNEI